MRGRHFTATVAAIAIAACTDASAATLLGYRITASTAPPAQAAVGSAIPIAFTATEIRSDGTSRPARSTAFTVVVAAGGGAVNGGTSATVTTDVNGSAALTWTLGSLAGLQSVRGLFASNDSLDLSVVAIAGPAAQLSVKAEPSATTLSGVALASQPTVQLEDAYGNPVAQAAVPVTASIVTGSDTLAGTVTVHTDATGVATFTDLVVNGSAGGVALAFVATVSGRTAMVTSSTVDLLLHWTTLAPMPTARAGLAVGVVNGILYAVGGSDGRHALSTVEAYDPAANTWTTKTPMPTPRSFLSVGVVNGILYAIGGENDTSNALTAVEAYDPATNNWTTKQTMPTARAGLTVGVVNGIVYAVGGDIGNASGLTTVEAYDPVANSWSARAGMSTPRETPAVSVLNGVLYAIGGDNAFTVLGTVEAYDPAANSWAVRTPMPDIRTDFAGAATNGNVYVVGGSGFGGSILATSTAYDPATNSWMTSTPAMAMPRDGFGIGVVNGTLYAVGGLNRTSGALGTVEAFSP